MACDICGKRKPTESISHQLELDGKAEVMCVDCTKIANTLLSKFRHMAWRRTRKKLLAMQKRYESKVQLNEPGGE